MSYYRKPSDKAVFTRTNVLAALLCAAVFSANFLPALAAEEVIMLDTSIKVAPVNQISKVASPANVAIASVTPAETVVPPEEPDSIQISPEEEDDAMKSFMAGMTYTPKVMPQPTAEEMQALVDELRREREMESEAILESPLKHKMAAKKMPVRVSFFDKAFRDAIVSKKALNFLMPVSNAIVSSGFGFRWGRMHDGIDLAVGTGTPIKAAEAGVVTVSGWQGGYGNFVSLNHGNGFITRYGHASKLLVHKGQVVKKGQTIGLVGSTGHSTGPHLHFEVFVNGRYHDPLAYLNRVINIAAK